VGVAIDLRSRTLRGLLSAGSPSTKVSTVDDDQRHGRRAAAALRARRRGGGRGAHAISGTIQNDILKEYVARGTYIYPPRPSMRLVTTPSPIARSASPAGTRSRYPATTSARPARPRFQELAFTLANGIALRRGGPWRRAWTWTASARRLSFFFNAHNDLFQEVAKYRAARRIWARIMTERFGGARREVEAAAVSTPQTAGVHPHGPAARRQRRPGGAAGALGRPRRDPEPAHQRLRRGLSGCRPEHAAKLALRTQQVTRFRVGRDRDGGPARRLLLRRKP